VATRLEVQQADVTKLEVDAIANAANTMLLHGGGVAGAIARAAGPELERESRERAPIELGAAVATTAGDMPSRWVIHAATMVNPGGRSSAEVIEKATRSTLDVAEELGARSIALVAFGTGVGGFPLDEGARITVETIRDELPRAPSIEFVVLALRGAAAYEAFSAAVHATEATAAATEGAADA
jgi:O-acetyl-ADP-ribose deacetylase